MSELTVEEQIVALARGESLETPTEQVETEPETTEEAPQAETDPDPGDVTPEAEQPVKFAGKYDTVEQLEQAYKEAQSLIGRQGNEVSELRRLSEQFEELKGQITQPAAPVYDPSNLEDFFTENPHQIPAYAEQALLSGDGALYGAALKAWSEFDSVGANDFHTRKLNDARDARLEAELAPLRMQAQAQQTTAQFQLAYEQLAESRADFNQVMSSITEDQMQGFPRTVLAGLQSNDPQARIEVLDTLYWTMKGRQAGNLTVAASQAVAEQQQEAQSARREATVASTTASSDRVQEVLAPNEAWLRQFEDSPAFKKYSGQS